MAQKVFVDDVPFSAADVNTFCAGEGGAWSLWTPTVTQSGSVAVTVTSAAYARYGRTIMFRAVLSVTGSGTGSNPIIVSLPVAAAAAYQLNHPLGSGYVVDDSASQGFPAILARATTTSTAYFITTQSSSVNSYLGQATMTAGLASGDTVFVSGMYEAAS